MVSKFKEKFTESYSLILVNDHGDEIKSWSVGVDGMRIDYDVDLPSAVMDLANDLVRTVHNDLGT